MDLILFSPLQNKFLLGILVTNTYTKLVYLMYRIPEQVPLKTSQEGNTEKFTTYRFIQRRNVC